MRSSNRTRTTGANWRMWLPVVGWVVVSVGLTQALLHVLLMNAAMSTYHLVAGLAQALLIFVPVTLYILWRGTAQRERAALQDLHRSEQLREDLAAMLVHDLKNPVIAVALAVDLLLKETEERDRTPPSVHERMVRARRNLQRLEDMIGDVLTISAAQAGRMALDAEPTVLCELVAEVVSNTAPQAAVQNIALVMADGCDAGLADIDREHIRRVLDNLISNAIAHTPSGGSIHVSVHRQADEAVVSVTDTGDGIDEELSHQLFERYVQSGASHNQSRLSVGLGLAFCKLAVEAHGGRIWAENVADGSRFSFALPMQS